MHITLAYFYTKVETEIDDDVVTIIDDDADLVTVKVIKGLHTAETFVEAGLVDDVVELAKEGTKLDVELLVTRTREEDILDPESYLERIKENLNSFIENQDLILEEDYEFTITVEANKE